MNPLSDAADRRRAGLVDTKVLATLGPERAYCTAQGEARASDIGFEQMLLESAEAGASLDLISDSRSIVGPPTALTSFVASLYGNLTEPSRYLESQLADT